MRTELYYSGKNLINYETLNINGKNVHQKHPEK